MCTHIEYVVLVNSIEAMHCKRRLVTDRSIRITIIGSARAIVHSAFHRCIHRSFQLCNACEPVYLFSYRHASFHPPVNHTHKQFENNFFPLASLVFAISIRRTSLFTWKHRREREKESGRLSPRRVGGDIFQAAPSSLSNVGRLCHTTGLLATPRLPR